MPHYNLIPFPMDTRLQLTLGTNNTLPKFNFSPKATLSCFVDKVWLSLGRSIKTGLAFFSFTNNFSSPIMCIDEPAIKHRIRVACDHSPPFFGVSMRAWDAKTTHLLNPKNVARVAFGAAEMLSIIAWVVAVMAALVASRPAPLPRLLPAHPPRPPYSSVSLPHP